jgi:hypothetical protein
VAGIVGAETVEPAVVLSWADGMATVAVGQARLLAQTSAASPGPAYVCVRGENVWLGDAAPCAGPVNHLTGTVRRVALEGPVVRVLLDCGFPLTALAVGPAWRALKAGDQAVAHVPASAVHLLPRE